MQRAGVLHFGTRRYFSIYANIFFSSYSHRQVRCEFCEGELEKARHRLPCIEQFRVRRNTRRCCPFQCGALTEANCSIERTTVELEETS